MATACKKVLTFCYLIVLVGCNADNFDTQNLEQSFLFSKSNGDYLVDESQSLTITEVLGKESGFKPSLEIPNKFMVNAAIWQRFEVENLSPEEKSLILIYKYNIIHQLSAYSLPLNQNTPKYSGTTVEPRQRDLKNWKMGFSFTFKPNEKKNIFIKSTTSDRVNLSHEWLTPKAYQIQLMQNLAAQNLFYGVMLVLILYNFFLFLSTSLKFYALYSIFAFFTLLTLASYDGYFNYLFPMNNESLWKHHGVIFMHLMVMTAAWFCSNLMSLHHRQKIGYYFIRGLLLANSISLTLCLANFNDLGLLIFDMTIILAAFMLVTISLQMAYQGSKLVKIFIISWVVLLITGVMALLMINNVIPHNTYLSFIGHFGIAFEMIITSFLIGLNLKTISIEKNLATQKAQAKTKEAGNLRNLVHILCHDINNPLAIIGGYSQSLNKKYDEKKSMKGWKKIHMAFQQIKDITAAVRELQANELNKKPLQINSIDLFKIIESAKFIFEQKLKNKDIALKSNISEPGLFMVMAEEVSLSHNVINNILSNAIKFSPKNSEIILNAKEIPDSNEIEISIQDFGIGMPKQLCESLFKLEHKTNRVGTAGEKGTGFGLPLVKSFVELYHGEVKVESYPQEEFPSSHGTVFKIFLHKTNKG
ncbi:MAG: 7TM diverse intracellular signaling domain-containing protein [Oligoflexales bacterium]